MDTKSTKSKYIDNSDPGNLPHTCSEIQGTVQWLFSEGASTLEEARANGFMDMGCFLGFEIKNEGKGTDVKKSKRGKVYTTGKLGQDVTLGVELSTKEVADMRKALIALMGSEVDPLTQAALAADTTVDLPAFDANAKAAKLNYAYQLLKDGKDVREITTLKLTVGINELAEGVDYTLDKKLGMVRFINNDTLPAAAVTAKATAEAIKEGDENYMLGIKSMDVPRRRGYSRILIWDGDPGSNLVMDWEPRKTDISVSGGFKVDAENQSEVKIALNFTSASETTFVRS